MSEQKENVIKLANKKSANLTIQDIDVIKNYAVNIALNYPNDDILDITKRLVSTFEYLNNIKLVSI